MSRERLDFVEFEQPQGGARRVRLQKAHVYVGRAPSCDIQLPDASISRRHARIERPAEGTWRVVDLGSKNGTIVNGERVELANVFDGDVIEVGNCRMTLRLEQATIPGMADLELDVEMEDTVAVMVESDEMPSHTVLPIRTLFALHDVIRRFNRATSLESLLDLIAQQFRATLKPDRVAVGIKSEGQYRWPIVMNGEGKPSDGSDLPQRLVQRAEGLTDSSPINWETLKMRGSSLWKGKEGVANRCFIFPIKVGGNRLGHIYAESRNPNWQPEPETIQFLSLLARQVGTQIEKIQLLEDIRAAEHVRLELTKARNIQLQLFPKDLDLDARLDIACRNHPAFSVSGDYYDCQPISPGKVAFIVADVMGHGIGAALLMTRLQAVFRMGVQRGSQLEELDGQLDEVMQTVSEEICFATGVLGLCDLANDVISITCAGHQWPSIFCNEEQVRGVDSAWTFPWGTPRTREVRPATIPLQARWSLLAYTDGVIDTRNEKGEFYSLERLAEVHERNLGRTAEELCESVLDDVLAYSDTSHAPNDDMTLLAICSKQQKEKP